jgi:hypothetical protein
MATDYSKMTAQEFDDILCGILKDMNGAELLHIPGVYEILSEYFNNGVLEIWAGEIQHGLFDYFKYAETKE